MNAKDFDFLLLCKDKSGVIRQVVISKEAIDVALSKEVIDHQVIKVIDTPIEGITWEKPVKRHSKNKVK